MSNIESKARRAVDAIIADLRGRNGLDGEWDAIDDGIKDEIRAEWVKTVVCAMEEP